MTCQAILDTDASLHDRRLGVAAGSFPDGRGPVICGSFNRNTSCPVSGSPAFPIDARDRKLCVPASRRVYPCLDELLVLSNLNYRPFESKVQCLGIDRPVLPSSSTCRLSRRRRRGDECIPARTRLAQRIQHQTTVSFCEASPSAICGFSSKRHTSFPGERVLFRFGLGSPYG